MIYFEDIGGDGEPHFERYHGRPAADDRPSHWLQIPALVPLDFVGVEFDPACLDIHRKRRAAKTPGAEQVCRPINRGGID